MATAPAQAPADAPVGPMRGNVAQRVVRLCALLGGIAHAVPALAAPSTLASPDLARQRHCLNCHAVDRKLVGPPLRDVAARYAASGESVVPVLAGKIRRGGSGAWGPVAMPANPQVTPAEAEALARWVLTLK